MATPVIGTVQFISHIDIGRVTLRTGNRLCTGTPQKHGITALTGVFILNRFIGGLQYSPERIKESHASTNVRIYPILT